MTSFKDLFLEFFGTFWLTIAVAGAVLAGIGQVGVGLSLGLGVAALLFATGSLGKAHYNPAVTIAMWAAKRIDAKKGFMYIIAQLIGGIIAALTLGLFFTNAAAGNYGATTLVQGTGFWTGIIIEIFLTMFLVLTVFGAPSQFAPLAIGLVLALDVFVAGGLTGASMNPARSFGPALVSNYWKSHSVYWIGPIIGGLIGAKLHNWWSKK